MSAKWWRVVRASDLSAYVDLKAREMLHQARSTAREAEPQQTSFLQDGPRAIWFTWTGTKIQRTLYGLGTYFGGFDVSDEGIALVFEKTTIARVRETYSGL